MFVSPHALTSRAVWHITEKGWSSDFPPLPSAFSPKWAMAWFSENKAECIQALSSVNAIKRSLMAFMLRSHNGVHCCGTVGDSHSSSQLIAAKRTFTGEGRGYASTFTKLFEAMPQLSHWLFPESRYKGKIIFWKRISFSDLFLILGAKKQRIINNS